MNKFLAEAAGALNILVALVLIVGGASLGTSAGAMGRGGEDAGLLMGALGGTLLAVLICGGLAVLIAIRDELRSLRIALAGTASHSEGDAPHRERVSAGGAATALPQTITFEGCDIPLRTVNNRQFAVLDDGRVLLRTRTGDVRTFDDLTSAEAYAGQKLA